AERLPSLRAGPPDAAGLEDRRRRARRRGADHGELRRRLPGQGRARRGRGRGRARSASARAPGRCGPSRAPHRPPAAGLAGLRPTLPGAAPAALRPEQDPRRNDSAAVSVASRAPAAWWLLALLACASAPKPQTRTFRYAGWLNQVKEKVGQVWTSKVTRASANQDPTGCLYSYRDRPTVTEFKVAADGRVFGAKVASSSGVEYLDRVAIDAF